MNWIDYTIFVILFFAMALGLASGPVLQLLRIGCLLVSFFAAIFFHSILGSVMKGIFTPSTANLLSYFVVFSVAFIATYIITDVLKRIMGRWEMGFGLRLFGALLGILKGLVFCGVIIFGVLLFCTKPTCDTVNASKIASQIGKGMQTIVSVVPESVSNKVRGYAEEIRKKKLSKDAKPEKPNKDEDFKPSL
ncbi:MAG TPA: CvpA family protein [Candidatus Wunengus sp. YC60]|uniref:CvpA family protein n=1 Tax=Candidatus Wunengus sp. YC60 TaxID=3367697 RepID=UPI004028CE02